MLETNQQKIGGGNTVTPNIIYHDVLLPIILLVNASMHYIIIVKAQNFCGETFA